MKFKYAFHLGRVFTLSLAELFSVFENMKLNFRLVELYREVLIIETENELDVNKLQKELGGSIKIMQVLEALGRKKMALPSQVFKDYFDAKFLHERVLTPSPSGKIQIGVSLYPLAKNLPFLSSEAKRLGLWFKKILTLEGKSTRVVFPQVPALSLPSVVVGGERLLEKGAEIDFLVGAERIFLARTLSIQNFVDYGRRDYQRPARNVQVGMLPPKVAQIMINLAQIPIEEASHLKSAILDPFAGSGTVIQEAILLGYKAVGADISAKAVEQAEKNLLWIKNRYKLPPGKFELVVSDVKDLSENLPKLNFLAIVTEGPLGPAYAKPPKEQEIKQNFKTLEKIYISGFSAFKDILGPQRRVVIALPCYRHENQYDFFEIIDKILDLGYTVLDPLPNVLLENFDFLTVTPRKSIIYDRKDQFVSREIFIFKLKQP